MRTLYLADLDAHVGYHDLPGQEPALVFLHGLGAASSADYPMVARDPHLAGHRAVLVDLLGFGLSDRPSGFSHTLEAHADVVADLLDHLGLTGCLLVGHSWGGSIAIVLAVRRPDLVAHLLVAEPNLEPADATISRAIADQPVDEFVGSGHARLVAEAEGWAAGDPRLGSYPATIRVADPTAMHRAATHLVASPLLATLLGLDVPRAYLVGESSLPDRHAETLETGGVSVWVVPGVSHGMMEEDPAAVAATVSAALTGRAGT